MEVSQLAISNVTDWLSSHKVPKISPLMSQCYVGSALYEIDIFGTFVINILLDQTCEEFVDCDALLCT